MQACKHYGQQQWYISPFSIPYLCLPEVVHHWQHHEYCIIGSAGCEGSNPDSRVKTTMADSVDEGDQAEEDEEELSQYKGRQHHEPFHWTVPIVPGHGVPLWVVRQHA